MGSGDLRETLAALTDTIRRPEALGPDDPDLRDVDAMVRPSARGMTSRERVEVYREMYWVRHLQSLAEDYPTLTWALGGPAAFDDLAREFLRSCPPRTWDLQRLGAEVPTFLERHSRWGALPVARDAARLDWAYMEIFDAPDAPPFDPTSLAAASEDAWPSARVELHPAVRLLALSRSVHEVRAALKAGRTPDEPEVGDHRVVVWRDVACFPNVVAVAPASFDLLVALSGGAALGPACEAVARATGAAEAEFQADLGAWFQDWTARGWLRAVRF